MTNFVKKDILTL